MVNNISAANYLACLAKLMIQGIKQNYCPTNGYQLIQQFFKFSLAGSSSDKDNCHGAFCDRESNRLSLA